MGVSADEAGGDALQHALRATTRDQDVEETKVVMGVRECCVWNESDRSDLQQYVRTSRSLGADMLMICVTLSVARVNHAFRRWDLF